MYKRVDLTDLAESGLDMNQRTDEEVSFFFQQAGECVTAGGNLQWN